METTIRDCHNPICGCGGCSYTEEPDRNCQFVICGCGCCSDELEGGE